MNLIKKTTVCLIVLLFWQYGKAQEPPQRIPGTNPNYEEGDWISYSLAKYITSIAIGDQYVYFGTRYSGITRYDQFKNRWDFPMTTSNGLADNAIFVVAYDFDTGLLWCASYTAISYYHPTAHRWTNLFKDEFGTSKLDEIVSIGLARDKVLFLTQSGQTFEANKYGGTIIASTSNDGSFPEGEIKWFGQNARQRRQFPSFFMSNGYLFDPQGIIQDPNFRKADVVVSLEDRWGNLWLGTWGLGAAKADLNISRIEMLPFGLADPVVSAMSFYESIMWFGGSEIFEQNQGITAWDANSDQWNYYEQRDISDLQSDEIHSITVDGQNILFGTDHGLAVYRMDKGRWKTYGQFSGLSDNRVFDTVANDSSIYVATANGIDRIVKKNMTKKDSLRIEHIFRTELTLVQVFDLELVKNLLWAATEHGVFVYDIIKKQGGFSNELGDPGNEVVRSISSFGDEVWFGTMSGVFVYNITKKEWLGVPEAQAFPNIPINRVLASDKAVWAATDQGVMKFNRANETWRKFDFEDGLIDNRVNALLLDGDYIWFGTEHGATQFYWNDPNRVD